jgi:putative colanic acid biosynthesis UDP-glucose lipid carrier transferase
VLHSPLETNHSVPHGAAQSDRWLVALSKLIDALAVIGTLAASVALYTPSWDAKYALAALLGAMVFFLLGEIGGLYRPWRGETVRRQFFQIAAIWAGTLFFLLLLAYALKVSGVYSRVTVGSWLVATPLLLTGWRVVARSIFERVAARKGERRNVVVWGGGELGDQLTRTIEGSPWLGLRLAEYIRVEEPDCPPKEPRESEPRTGWAPLEQLELKAKRGAFDILYIALPTTARAQITDLLDWLADATVTV